MASIRYSNPGSLDFIGKQLASMDLPQALACGVYLGAVSAVTPAPPTPTTRRYHAAYPPAQPSTRSSPDSQSKTLQQLPQPMRRYRRRQFQHMIAPSVETQRIRRYRHRLDRYRNYHSWPNDLIGTMLANPIAKRLGIQTMFTAIRRLRQTTGLPCFDMNSSFF